MGCGHRLRELGDTGGNEVETEEKELGIKSNEPKGDEK